MFALQFLQARNADWVRKPFYARFDPHATWMDDLKPAFGKDKFFFEEERPDLACASLAHEARKVIPLVPQRHGDADADAAAACVSHSSAA